MLIMERSFSFEAKTFCLLAKDGCPNLRFGGKEKRICGVHFCEHSMLVVVGGYGRSGD